MTPPLSPLPFPLLYVGTAGQGLATNFTYNAQCKSKECLPFFGARIYQASSPCMPHFPLLPFPPASSTSVLNAPAISSQREREGERRRRRRGEGGTRFISPGSKCNQLAFFLLPYFFSLLRRRGTGEGGETKPFPGHLALSGGGSDLQHEKKK